MFVHFDVEGCEIRLRPRRDSYLEMKVMSRKEWFVSAVLDVRRGYALV